MRKHSCHGATDRSAILICFHRPQHNHALYFLRDAKTKCGFGQWFNCGFLPALQSKYKTLGTGRVLPILSHIIQEGCLKKESPIKRAYRAVWAVEIFCKT